MWVFVSILFLVGTLHFVLNLSMIKKNWILTVTILCTAASIFTLLPFSKSINAGWFINYLNDYNLISLACTIQVAESFLVLIATATFIKSKIQDSKIPMWGYLSFFPSPIFLAGLFMIQTGALYYMNGTSFHRIGFILAVTVSILLFSASLVARRITGTNIDRMEFKVYLSLLQLILAMFLPVTIKGGTMNTTQFEVDMILVITSWGGMLLVCILGFHLTRLKARLKNEGRDDLFHSNPGNKPLKQNPVKIEKLLSKKKKKKSIFSLENKIILEE